MRPLSLSTYHLELKPLPAEAASALPDRREDAAGALGAHLHPEWPDPNLLGVFRRHAGSATDMECFGVWVMIERDTVTVVGDIGFHGPPDDAGTVEIGYNVIPARRRHGYATEAAAALVEWALAQPEVNSVMANCDAGNVGSVSILERVGFRRIREAGSQVSWRCRATRPRTDVRSLPWRGTTPE